MPASVSQKPLLGKFRLTSRLRLETGLHVGGGGENLDIGGLDKPVIRNPLTLHPYIPGSSIKGKLRSLLERLLNKPLNRPGGSGTYRYESDDLENGYTEIREGQSSQFIPFEGAKTCQVSRLFGSTGSNCWIQASVARAQGLAENNKVETIYGKECLKIKGRNAPARLIVRDCKLLPESAEKLTKVDTGLYMTEWKFENGMDRITAAANPRQLERVPAGAEFQFELVYTVENAAQVEEDLRNLAIALAILEDDALGGHGSRGYGKISFQNFNFFYRSIDEYIKIAQGGGDGLGKMDLAAKDTPELLETFGSLKDQIQKLLPGDESQA